MQSAGAVTSSDKPAAATPGERPADSARSSSARSSSLAAAAVGGIQPMVTVSGKVALSTDGLGTQDATGTLQVQKPAGATVRGAYLASATTGFSGVDVTNGDVSLQGVSVTYSSIVPSGISSSNGFADVTSIVKPVVDAAPAGIVDLRLEEASSGDMDGTALAVIFDDPSQPSSNTVVVLFGAQQTTGDTFNIGLSDPIDTCDPDLRLDLALGISFGFQPGGQYSQIDVNGQRLTTSAGGQDDADQDCPDVGDCGNGALLTMGGVGDSNANPPDPLQEGCGNSEATLAAAATGDARCDDELYNLLPFVKDGDTAITVDTLNPSNDDNIFLAALTLNSTTAVVGQGITLTPASAVNPVGTNHTLTATVQDTDGNPVVGRSVTFNILSGPNAGGTSSSPTNATGKATWTYSSATAGTDTIEASFVDDSGATVRSNQATKTWESARVDSPTDCRVTALRRGPPAQQDVTVNDADGIARIFNVVVSNGSVNVPAFSPGTTGPVVLTATKSNQSQRTVWSFDVEDSFGNVKHCV